MRTHHVLTRAPQSYDAILHYTVWLVYQPDPELWPGSKPPVQKKKKKALTMLNFDFDQKVKIFKIGLSHSVFRIHSNFEIRFFIRSSEIAQTLDF